MNVKPGVPYVNHPNQCIRSDIYSQLLVIPDLKINIPDIGQKVAVFVPVSQDKVHVKNLLTQIGFDGLVKLTELNFPEGTEFTVIVEH